MGVPGKSRSQVSLGFKSLDLIILSVVEPTNKVPLFCKIWAAEGSFGSTRINIALVAFAGPKSDSRALSKDLLVSATGP